MPSSPASSTAAPAHPDPQLRTQVERIISLIRPAVQSDGGDLELVNITPDGVVQIRLHGACVGCPSSTMTLQLGIERNLRDHLPAIKGVQAVP
jgi:Fe-S cluster biogenesis protein NfuA